MMHKELEPTPEKMRLLSLQMAPCLRAIGV